MSKNEKMRKTLATILTGISLAFGSLSKANDLPMEIELQNGKYTTYEEVTLEKRNMSGTKVIDRSQNQPAYLKGEYSPEGRISISYSTHPFEQKAIRPKQGFASNSRIYVGIPEGAEIEVLSQRAEFIGNFDRAIETDLKPLEETKYAKTFLKMGNNGMEKLREYDPIQQAASALNDSIFLLTGTDLTLEDKISIYGGLKAFTENVDRKEQERGKSTFKGNPELKKIELWPFDSTFYQPSETKREITFKIKPGTYTGETIPFTVYQKLILGREPTEGIGKLEAFFTGEIANAKGQIGAGKQQGIIEAISALQGYWKYTGSPGWLKSYVEIKPVDQKTIEIKWLEVNTNEGRPKEEKSVLITYDPEKKLLEMKGKRKSNSRQNEEIEEKTRFYGVRRLSKEEKEKEDKEISESSSFVNSIGLHSILIGETDQNLLDESGDRFGPCGSYTRAKWYKYRKTHPYVFFDEDSKDQPELK